MVGSCQNRTVAWWLWEAYNVTHPMSHQDLQVGFFFKGTVGKGWISSDKTWESRDSQAYTLLLFVWPTLLGERGRGSQISAYVWHSHPENLVNTFLEPCLPFLWTDFQVMPALLISKLSFKNLVLGHSNDSWGVAVLIKGAGLIKLLRIIILWFLL